MSSQGSRGRWRLAFFITFAALLGSLTRTWWSDPSPLELPVMSATTPNSSGASDEESPLLEDGRAAQSDADRTPVESASQPDQAAGQETARALEGLEKAMLNYSSRLGRFDLMGRHATDLDAISRQYAIPEDQWSGFARQVEEFDAELVDAIQGRLIESCEAQRNALLGENYERTKRVPWAKLAKEVGDGRNVCAADLPGSHGHRLVVRMTRAQNPELFARKDHVIAVRERRDAWIRGTLREFRTTSEEKR